MPTAELLPGVAAVPSEKPLLTFQVESDLLRAVDKWRFAHEFPSRAAAIKALLRWALAQQPELRPAE